MIADGLCGTGRFRRSRVGRRHHRFGCQTGSDTFELRTGTSSETGRREWWRLADGLRLGGGAGMRSMPARASDSRCWRSARVSDLRSSSSFRASDTVDTSIAFRLRLQAHVATQRRVEPLRAAARGGRAWGAGLNSRLTQFRQGPTS